MLNEQSKFRILKDWDIRVVNSTEYSGQCSINLTTKSVIIYPWHDGNEPADYILHEILHVAIRAIKTRDDEELVVQDLCQIIKEESP